MRQLTPTSSPRRILIIITRRIGDVLLATPLIRSVRSAWPNARLDALVFESTAGVLAANHDIDRIIAVPERPRFWPHARLILSLIRRYDLAVSMLTGDRPTLYAWLAGRHRIGFVEENKGRWKQSLLSHAVAFDNLNTHTVLMNLQLADALGITRHYEIVIGWSSAEQDRVGKLLDGPAPYAVLHPYPKFNYKMWHDEGWAALAESLSARDLRIVITGGPDPAESAYAQRLLERFPPATMNLAGRLTLAETACLLSRARIYIGPDTATTHLAAAMGTPTVALYGPSNPVKWGPWPRQHRSDRNPWQRLGSKRLHNVALIQGNEACVPCLQEGCDRHIGSFSDCLRNLPADKVIAAANALLAIRAP